MSGNGSPDDGNVVPAGGVGSTLNSQAGNEGPDVGSYGLSTGAIVGICVAIGAVVVCISSSPVRRVICEALLTRVSCHVVPVVHGEEARLGGSQVDTTDVAKGDWPVRYGSLKTRLRSSPEASQTGVTITSASTSKGSRERHPWYEG